MTLDEAIKNYEKIAEENQRVVDTGSVINDVAIYYQRRAGEYRQLAGWLKELRQLKEQVLCNDAISRQAVLEKAKDYGGQTYLIPVNSVKTLPPVIPQTKTGHWIRVDKNKLKCSECGVIHLIAQYPLGKIDWCPNCGTKMQKDKEESEE